MTEGNFNVISLFSGCGGSSLGYHMAGGNVLCAVEKEKHAANNYIDNFPETELFKQDICKVTSDDLLNAAGLDTGELDILDGSPPCQGFSVCGAHNPNNPKNQLYTQYVRLLRDISPKTFIMENVPGMRNGAMKPIFYRIHAELRKLGYGVFEKQLNAKNYGVPQSRSRMIFVGIRDDVLSGLQPGFNDTHPAPKKYGFISAREALDGVPDDDKHFIDNELCIDIWNRCKLGVYFSEYHPKGQWFNSVKLNPDLPSPTLKAKIMIHGEAGFFHWDEPRFLTIAEIKRLQSFPDDFRLSGGFIHEWRCVGNSVPPLMMKAVAEHVNKRILCNEVNT